MHSSRMCRCISSSGTTSSHFTQRIEFFSNPIWRSICLYKYSFCLNDFLHFSQSYTVSCGRCFILLDLAEHIVFLCWLRIFCVENERRQCWHLNFTPTDWTEASAKEIERYNSFPFENRKNLKLPLFLHDVLWWYNISYRCRKDFWQKSHTKRCFVQTFWCSFNRLSDMKPRRHVWHICFFALHHWRWCRYNPCFCTNVLSQSGHIKADSIFSVERKKTI